MPNGKPGDHPLTDIVIHKLPTFGTEIDDKVRRIHSIASSVFQSHLAELLWDWPRRDPTELILNPEGLSHVLDTLLACIEAHRTET